MACSWATADTKPLERFMTKAKSQFACDPRVIRAVRATNLQTRYARINDMDRSL